VKRLVVDVRGGDYSSLRLPPGTAPEPHLFTVGGVTVVSVISGPDGVTVVCPTRVAPESDNRDDGWRLLSVRGPLEFALTGIMAALAGELGAVRALREAGHEVGPL
jgi:hypothetical protein